MEDIRSNAVYNNEQSFPEKEEAAYDDFEGEFVNNLKSGLNGLDPRLVSIMDEEVVNARKKHRPMARAFEAVASRSGLKVNTVRNYFYRYLKNVYGENESIRKPLSGDLGRPFNNDETDSLVINMLTGKYQGKSIRAIAAELGNSDPRLLLRFQNKYRNLVARNRPFVDKIMKDLRLKGQNYYDPYQKKHINAETMSEYERENFDIINRLKTVRTDQGYYRAWDEDSFEHLMQKISTDIRSIGGGSAMEFIQSLRNITLIAARPGKTENESEEDLPVPQKLMELVKQRDAMLREANARLMVQENSLRNIKEERDRLKRQLNSLMDTCSIFVNRKVADQKRMLKDFTEGLKGQMEEYRSYNAE